MTNFKHTKGAPHSLLVNDVRKTILEGDSGMWVAYQYQKAEVSYFSFREESFTHFSLDSISNNSYLFDILRQGEKTLWAISNETLYRLDIDKHVVEKMIPNDSTYWDCLLSVWMIPEIFGLVPLVTDSLNLIPILPVLYL